LANVTQWEKYNISQGFAPLDYDGSTDHVQELEVQLDCPKYATPIRTIKNRHVDYGKMQ